MREIIELRYFPNRSLWKVCCGIIVRRGLSTFALVWAIKQSFWSFLEWFSFSTLPIFQLSFNTTICDNSITNLSAINSYSMKIIITLILGYALTAFASPLFASGSTPTFYSFANVTFVADPEEQIPSCAVPCIQGAIKKDTSCEYSDIACVCLNRKKISSSAKGCVISACGLNKAISTYFNFICEKSMLMVCIEKVVPAVSEYCKVEDEKEKRRKKEEKQKKKEEKKKKKAEEKLKKEEEKKKKEEEKKQKKEEEKKRKEEEKKKKEEEKEEKKNGGKKEENLEEEEEEEYM